MWAINSIIWSSVEIETSIKDLVEENIIKRTLLISFGLMAIFVIWLCGYEVFKKELIKFGLKRQNDEGFCQKIFDRVQQLLLTKFMCDNVTRVSFVFCRNFVFILMFLIKISQYF